MLAGDLFGQAHGLDSVLKVRDRLGAALNRLDKVLVLVKESKQVVVSR